MSVIADTPPRGRRLSLGGANTKFVSWLVCLTVLLGMIEYPRKIVKLYP